MAGIYQRNGAWCVRWRDGIGKLRRRVTNAKTRREAQALLDELVGQAQRVKLGLERAPVESRLTLAALVEWWLNERCPEPSREMQRMQLRKHVGKSELADYPLPALTADLLETKVFERMEKLGSAPATVNRVRGSLHSAFAAASLPPRRWSGHNPIEETRARAVPKVARPTLTPEQVELVLLEVRDLGWRGVMAVAAYMGLRRGEIYALTKGAYDRERQTLLVGASNHRDTTKAGTRITLPVPSILRPFLELARRSEGLMLFPGKSGLRRTREADPHLILRRAIARTGVVAEWLSYCLTCQRAGRPNERLSPTRPAKSRCSVDKRPRRIKAVPLKFRFHDLRHTCGTNLIKAGVPLSHVSRILRHSSIRVTDDVYGHLSTEDLREAIELVSAPSKPKPSHSSLNALTGRARIEHKGGEKD